eukprot:m.486602 g.486602  ORF g.486602 m.486602 type:complete len:123 (+) comp24516_c0_seq1:216-584(+)
MAATEENTYIIRPHYQDKFRPAVVQEVIHSVLVEKLSGKQYDTDESLQLSTEICDEVKSRLKGLQLQRYKFVVQATIGEQRGEGAKVAARCLWDSDTDNFAQDVFMNETLFCVAAAFGVYHY